MIPSAQPLKRRIQAGAQTWGAWLNLASPLSAELIASLGFDWVCIDMEHGPGDMLALQSQLQAIRITPGVTPVVRIAANDPALIKWVLDVGAEGIVVPSVDSAQEGEAAVQAVRYPPKGRRGVARASRALPQSPRSCRSK